jgi:putative PIN family toxin of toxin-antitoxin system
MSADAITVRLDHAILAALQEAAARRHMSLDQMAGEAIAEGLKTERLNRLHALLSKGHQHGAATGIPEDSVVELIHADREHRRKKSR